MASQHVVAFTTAVQIVPNLRYQPVKNRERVTCPPIATAGMPPRRKAALSTLAVTTALSAATGAPGLAGSAALFTAIGLAAEAPVGLVGLAAGLCAALADFIAVDIGSASFDSGVLPFVVFALGSTVAGVLETGQGGPFAERLGATESEGEASRVAIQEAKQAKEEAGNAELRSWDDEFSKRT